MALKKKKEPLNPGFFHHFPQSMAVAKDAIIARAQGSRRAAVIGGGLLGLEAAKALMDLGMAPRQRAMKVDKALNEISDTLANCSTTTENHHFEWENSLFQWPCSVANCSVTRGYHPIRLNHHFPMVFLCFLKL